MIYEVYLDDKLLYFPNDETYSIIDGVVETSLNEAGTFECDVPVSNPCYEAFSLRKSMIQVLKDGVEIFFGEVREVKQNFDFTKHIYAVGELAFLFDSIQPQAKYQTTPEAMFTSLLAYHNSQVEDRKKFQKGIFTVTDPNNYVYHFTNREDTLTDIREKLCNTLNGYLRVRKVNGVRYLDMIPLENYGRYCTQEISFGENLLDYSANYTAQDVATCVIPLGARLEDDKRTTAAIEGLDEYLTIKGTSVDSYHRNENDDYVYIQTAVNTFGWVRVVKTWDEVTNKNTLKQKAIQWLTSAQYSKLELELNAVDLSILNQDIDTFEVGDTIHAWAEPYNMDTTFPVRKKTTYLNDLSKNYIVLGNTETSKSYTKQSSNAVSALKEEIPQTYSVLTEARSQALALLLDETQGGYVVYEYHYTSGKADYIEAINVCDAPTIAASISRWRWSRGGFGYMYRNRAANMTETSPPWQGPLVALTSDGKINASRIITGTLDAGQITVENLNAESINAGILKAQNNKYTLDMATGKVKMQDGEFTGTIAATSGTIGKNSNANSRWQIGDHDIHNGPTTMNSDAEGVYIGVDGIRFNQAPSGASPRAYTKISKGGIQAQTLIESTGGVKSNQLYTTNGGSVTAYDNSGGYGVRLQGSDGSVQAKSYKVQDGSSVYNGYTGQITWSDGSTGHSIIVNKGLITGMS